MENINLIPARTSRSSGGVFKSSSEMSLDKIDTDVSGTILSRYYKGIEGDHSMCVIVITRL